MRKRVLHGRKLCVEERTRKRAIRTGYGRAEHVMYQVILAADVPLTPRYAMCKIDPLYGPGFRTWATNLRESGPDWGQCPNFSALLGRFGTATTLGKIFVRRR
jgi:hypothetical protein